MMRPFLLRNRQTEQFFFALYCLCEKRVDRLGDIAAIFSNFVVDGIAPQDWIDGVKIALAPSLQLRQQLVGHGIDCPIRDSDAVHRLNMLADILIARTEGK